MEDGVEAAKMGATGHTNAIRLAALQERKKSIEEKLSKHTHELEEICRKEAEITGIMPVEMPLEPGEAIPTIRRCVGAAYQLPENLLKNSIKGGESVAELELQIQLHANLAEAALGLAKESNSSKTVRRQHKAEYDNHKKQCILLREKLTLLKEKLHLAEQQKLQKKKAKVPDQEDNVSITTINEPFPKSESRHSLRKQSVSSKHLSLDQRLPSANLLQQPQHPDNVLFNSQYNRVDDIGFYRLSLNGYKTYAERNHDNNNIYPPQMYQTLEHKSSAHYSPSTSHSSQHSSPMIGQHSPNLSSHSTSSSQIHHSPVLSSHHQTLQYNHQRASQQNVFMTHGASDYGKFNMTGSLNMHLHRQSSPISTGAPILQHKPPQYYPAHTIHGQPYRQYQNAEREFRNPHQIPPHQQYEQNVMTSGLGGCWKRTDNGEMIWCTNASKADANWQWDKRFGSLDRRKNKRLHKRVFHTIEPNSVTAPPNQNYPDHMHSASVKSSQIITRPQDNRQLVRTQSLGSVGVQAVDSVYPSDDNSSFDSDRRSINDLHHNDRRHKEKEWLETSLDGPASPASSSLAVSQSHPQFPLLILSPEEKYQSVSPPQTPKPPLEIPAESNPSPRLAPDTNLDLFNNIPKNCTVVQAGHCKPYHEETKPFEMSDFYKYSTKFKKSPEVKAAPSYHHPPPVTSPFKNNASFNYNSDTNNSNNSSMLNNSLDLSHIAVSENFSAEMNAWYRKQDHHTANNNTPSPTNNNSKSRSTATLV